MNPPREVLRTVRRRGGQIVKATTRFDQERGGRVLELTAFWPERTGYDDIAGGDAAAGAGVRGAAVRPSFVYGIHDWEEQGG